MSLCVSLCTVAPVALVVSVGEGVPPYQYRAPWCDHRMHGARQRQVEGYLQSFLPQGIAIDDKWVWGFRNDGHTAITERTELKRHLQVGDVWKFHFTAARLRS